MVLFFTSLLGMAGLLPQPLYDLYYHALNTMPGEDVPPYMQKFEGMWHISLIPSMNESDFGPCHTLSGTVTAHNGIFSGTVGQPGLVFTFKAAATPDGLLAGTLMLNASKNGTLQGVIVGTSGVGEWSDSLDCSGSIQFAKADAVVDPTQGRVVSFDGMPTLVRGGVSTPLQIGESLYVGDTIQTGAGGVLVALGSAFTLQTKTIPSHTTFTVFGDSQ
jgi:hypothetical protein